MPETDSTGPETEPGSLETELRANRIHDTLEHRISDYPSQPGGPSQGGDAGWQEARFRPSCFLFEGGALHSALSRGSVLNNLRGSWGERRVPKGERPGKDQT